MIYDSERQKTKKRESILPSLSIVFVTPTSLLPPVESKKIGGKQESVRKKMGKPFDVLTAKEALQRFTRQHRPNYPTTHSRPSLR